MADPRPLQQQPLTRHATQLSGAAGTTLDRVTPAHARLSASRCCGQRLRTTVTLEADVAAAVEQARRDGDIGVSEAVNRLIRAGLTLREESAPYVHETHELGLKVDVANIGEVLDLREDTLTGARRIALS